MPADDVSIQPRELHDIEELSRMLLENSAERVDLLDRAGRFIDTNALGRSSLGSAATSRGRPWEELWSESERSRVRAALERARQGLAATFDVPTSARARLQVRIVALCDRHGDPQRFIAVSRAGERERWSPPQPAASSTPDAEHIPTDASEQLRLSEERLRLAITGAALGTWHWDFRTGKQSWSDLTFAMYGLQPGSEMSYQQFMAAVHPSDRARVDAAVARSIREHTDYESEHRIVWPDRSVHWLLGRARAYYDEHGNPLRMEGVSQDITARKNTERALRESEERYRQLAEAMPHLVWQLGSDGNVVYANRRWREYLGRASLAPSEWHEVIHPDDLDRIISYWTEQIGDERDVEPFRLRACDGSYQWFACRTVTLRDADGRINSYLSSATPVESLKRTEQALRESRARLDTALRAAGMGTWVWQIDSDQLQLDSTLTQLFDCSASEAAGHTMTKCLERAHPDDRATLRAAALRVRDQGGEFDVEFRLPRKTGGYLWVNSKGRAEVAPDGRVLQVFGACVDATQHRRLEDELRQSQKMEAIGQLAGGIAHDFNNLLMVIQGQASLAAGHAELPASTAAAIREISDAAERAAGLTAQLLAFGRRQRLQIRPLDLSEVVTNIGNMLKRLISENVVLSIETDSSRVPVCADPNTLGQVVLNLALNARDAMPLGGRLEIRTSCEVLSEREAEAVPDGRPGRWACLTVSDSGEGIASDVLPHIFEPFFTTKGVGKGTGLGLATVYGIVKQHHGFVSVESSVGRGSTFKVYLPPPTHASEVGAAPPAVHAVSGHGELVLLVEDDASVRGTVSRILEQHNYRLVAADDAVQALELFSARGSEIDVLLTDVVLPRGLSGVELAVHLRYQNPRLRVVLCSGYGAEQVGPGMEALPGMTFLQKPYRAEELLTVLRSMLDKTRAASQQSATHSLRS